MNNSNNKSFLNKQSKNEIPGSNIIEKFSSLLGYTIGKVEISYFEGNDKKVVYSLGFLLQSNIVFCAGKTIKKLKDRGLDLNILYFPTDPRITNKYGINNCNDFVSVYNTQTLPEIKDKTNFDPFDSAYHEKDWCILTLKNILGEFIYVLNSQDPEYFQITTPPKDIRKAMFVFLSKNSEGRNEIVSMSLDQSKIIYSNGLNSKNDDSYFAENQNNQQNKDTPRLLILIPQTINLVDAEGFLFHFNESKFNCIGIYTGAIESKKNISYLEQYFREDLDNIQTTLGRITDIEYSVLELQTMTKDKDINVIDRITKDIKQLHFRDFGIKTFPYNIYSDFKMYFNSQTKVNVLLNYGETLLEKLASKMKIQLRNIDIELLMKRILNDCCYGYNNCKPIEKMELKNENISQFNFKISLETFYMSNMINSVAFHDIFINSKLGYYISDLFFHNRQIKELVLNNNKINLDTLDLIFKSLVYTRLEIFNLNKNSFYIEDEFIEEKLLFFNLVNIPSLKRVYMRNLKMSSSSLIYIFQNMTTSSKKFKDLNSKIIKENMSDYYIKNLFRDKYDSQTNSERENLRVFNFSGNECPKSLLTEMNFYLVQFPCIQELYLSNCLINDISINVLAKTTLELPLLTILDLSHNNITSESISFLSEMLNYKGSNEEPDINDKKKKTDGGKRKVHMSLSNNNLNNLQNNLNLLKSVNTEEALFTFTLKLNYNPLGNNGISEFFFNLSSSCIPVKLELDGTAFGVGGLESISSCLERNAPIIQLSIGRNAFTDKTFIDIFTDFGNSIKRNKHLRKVIINKNFISKELLVKIFEPITTIERQTLTISNAFIKDIKSYRKNFSIICDPLVSIYEAYALYHKYLNETRDINFTLFDTEEIIEKLKDHDLISKDKNKTSLNNFSSKLKIKKELVNQTNSESINIKDRKKGGGDIERNYEDLIHYIEYCK